MAFGALAYDPLTGLPIGPDQPVDAPVVPPQQGVFSKALSRLTGTQFGEPRLQTWPEKLLRSATTLPGDVLSGAEPVLPPGLRREDYTDIPAPSGVVAAQPNDPMMERAQDLAGMAGGGMMFGSMARPAAETGVRVLGRQVMADSATPGAPLAALEASVLPRRINPLENAEQLKELANQRRARGEAVGKSADGWDFKRPDPEPGTLEWDHAVAKAEASAAAPSPDSPLLSADDHAFIRSGKFYEDSAVPGAPLAALEHAKPFYSAAERTVEALPMNKATGEQWAATLANRGVKPEEMDWTGLRSFLSEKGNAPVTKAEVQAHLVDNGLKLGEVHKGDVAWEQLSPARQDRIVDDFHNAYPDAPENPDLGAVRNYYNEQRAQGEYRTGSGEDGTKYHGYQLPGGENYREKLLTLQKKWKRETFDEARKRIDAGDFPQDYRSSHWDEPNVLVHRRTNERDVSSPGFTVQNARSGNKSQVFESQAEAEAYQASLPESVRGQTKIVPDAAAKRSLHLEEIQSDWHQAGRRQGYNTGEISPDDVTMKFVKSEVPEGHDPRNYPGYWESFDKNGDLISRHGGNRPEDVARQEAMTALRNNRAALPPDAPFKKNWHELALKDAIREAAEKGFDRISWTPGEAQAARYDLSKSVSKVHYMPDLQGGTLAAEGLRPGQTVLDKSGVKPEQIADYVGKDVAEKLLKTANDKDGIHTLEGVDLKVGGEGMKGFYDKMIPDALNKIGKPHGVKAQRGEVATDRPGFDIVSRDGSNYATYASEARARSQLATIAREERVPIDQLTVRANPTSKAPVHYMDIPPSLKEQALKKGFSLFEDSATAGAPLSALERAAQQGYNIDAFHGTSAPPFEAFKRKPNDIGIHFGTTDQANDRISYMGDRRPGDPHVYPVKLKIKNPLRTDDLGSWRSDNLFYGLGNAKKPDGTPLFDKEELRRAAFSAGNEAGRTKALRDLIERKGYDGIVYKNTGETGGSEPYREAVAAARAKMDEAFGERKYSFSPEDQKHPAYEEWRKAEDSYDRHRKENAQDSYIAFYPHQVRSRFAEFDPKNAKKGGLLLEDAATTGAPISALEHAAGATDATKAATAREAAAPARGDGPGGAGGGDTGLREAQAAAARRAGAHQPLADLPTKAMKIGDEYFVPGPIGKVRDVAAQYMADRETPSYHKPPEKYHPLDEEHSRAIARAFDEMKHNPDDPATKASYEALIKETAAQYQAVKNSGLKIEPIPKDMPDPYAKNPRLAAKDVAENNHLWFFPTDAGFGSNPGAKIDMATHPMMQKTGEKIGDHELLANDMFRIVHDYFGHLKEGYGFRAAGEDNAWRSHASMYSDLARPAMTTETRGQNSWVNYGPHGEKNRTASGADTVYADQKVGLMPEWTMRDRGSPEPTIAYHGSPYSFDKFDPAHIGAGEGNQAYGHGLYFAGHEPVSEWYRHQLAARRDGPILQKYGLDSEDGASVGMRLAAVKGDVPEAIAGLEKEIAGLRSDGDTSKGTQNMIKRRRAMVDYLKDPERNPGHMYEVAIDAKPEEFLDWDKPLKEQPQALKAVRKVVPEWLRPPFEKNVEHGITGGNAYQNYAIPDPPLDNIKLHPHVRTARALREVGVPGIKYLDQGSRSMGGGTSNYVTFSAPRMLKRYAVPGLIGAGGFGSLAPRKEK